MMITFSIAIRLLDKRRNDALFFILAKPSTSKYKEKHRSFIPFREKRECSHQEISSHVAPRCPKISHVGLATRTDEIMQSLVILQKKKKLWFLRNPTCRPSTSHASYVSKTPLNFIGFNPPSLHPLR